MFRKLLLDSSTLHLLKRGLEATTLRHRVVADNIANAETPGHRPQDVRFETLFRAATESDTKLASTESGHRARSPQAVLPSPRVETAPVEDPQQRLEKDLVTLVENATKQRALLGLVKSHYNGLVTAIRGRSGLA